MAYAAAERRETGKSNDLCSSLDLSSEVLIAVKTQTSSPSRILVQVLYCQLTLSR